MLSAAGLLADTVILRSPTTTGEDRRAAEDLARIAGLDMEDFGREIFSHSTSLSEEDPATVAAGDFKVYKEAGIGFGIGQVEVTGFSDMDGVRESYLNALDDLRREKRLDWTMLLVTDVLHETSRLLCTPLPAAERLMPWDRPAEGEYELPGILSRKKQLLPEILRILDESEEENREEGG